MRRKISLTLNIDDDIEKEEFDPSELSPSSREHYDSFLDHFHKFIDQIKRDRRSLESLNFKIYDEISADELRPKSISKKEKLSVLLREMHQNEWVKSQNLKSEYTSVYGEDLPLSSVATYLARLHEDGLLERRGTRAQREYKL